MRVLSYVRSSLLIATLLACTSEQATGPSATPESGPLFNHTPAGVPLLVITEVMPNPAATNDVSEYIEIFNAGASEANLNGLSLRSASGTGTGIVTVAITANVPVASGACVLLSTHSAPINGVPVSFAYGTNGSMMFTNGSTIDYMELLQGTTVVDRVTVGVNPGNHNGFSMYLIEGPADITLVDNSIITGTGSTINAPWKRATTSDPTWGTLAERGTPGQCNYGKHVVAGEVTDVNVSDMTIAATQTGVVSASATDALGYSVTTTFTWTSSNESVVRVTNPATGAIEALAVGTATLTATSANGVQGSGIVTVIDGQAVATVTASFTNSPTLVPGYQRRVFVTVNNVLGQRIFPTVTYSSSNEGVATINSRGYVTAVAPGSTVITASVDGVAGQVTVNVQTILHPSGAVYRNHTDFGDPFDGNSADDKILRKREYSLSYSTVRGGPVWVSWNLNSTQFRVPGRPRCDCFSQDQELAALDVAQSDIIGDWDYVGGGYDRGHMVQSASRNITDTQNASTFLMTNMLPQAADNNQGPWNDMEEDLNDLASAGKELYIMAGGIYGANPKTLRDSGKVQIPDYTWKVAVIMPAAGTASSVDYFDDFEIIAVKMPNDTATAVRNIDWKVYKTTVDQIESETGLDLLRALPDDIEIPVEAGDRPPVAAMTVPSASVEGSAVLLDARASSDVDGDALTYTWTLSDGTTLNGALVSHVFADNGSKTVTLTVRDPLGAWNTKTTTISVANASPVATLTSTGTAVSGEPFAISAGFTDAGAFDGPWNVSIDWGNGVSSTTPTSVQGVMTTSNTYTTAGSYTVTLTVTDKDGGFASRTLNVVVVRREIGLVAQEVINDNEVGNASIKVTALGDAGFDVSLVDLSTACISGVCVREKGNSGQTFASYSDVDGDGDMDLVMRFARRDLVRVGALPVGSPELVFEATLSNGQQVEGRSTVSVH